jgi:hypothetical protein
MNACVGSLDTALPLLTALPTTATWCRSLSRVTWSALGPGPAIAWTPDTIFEPYCTISLKEGHRKPFMRVHGDGD